MNGSVFTTAAGNYGNNFYRVLGTLAGTAAVREDIGSQLYLPKPLDHYYAPVVVTQKKAASDVAEAERTSLSAYYCILDKTTKVIMTVMIGHFL